MYLHKSGQVQSVELIIAKKNIWETLMLEDGMYMDFGQIQLNLPIVDRLIIVEKMHMILLRYHLILMT